ncbi:MAG: hypothetical protein ACE5HN_06575 [Nitrospiria bacterium]
MRSEKIRRFIGLISVGVVLLSGVYLSGAEAQTELVSAEEAMSEEALFEEIERLEASMPPPHVWNMTPREVKEAKLNWAIGEMGKAVSAAVRGEETGPIPANAVFIVRSKGGFGQLDDFRLALTLLSEERGQSMTHLVPGPVTPKPARAINYAEAGWGGFAEYGFFSLVAFAYVMWMFSWAMTDLEHHVPKEEEKPYEYPMAA